MKNWLKCHFDTYVKRKKIVGVYVWEMYERDKVVGYQVLVDTGCRLLVYRRVKEQSEAVAVQEKLIDELDNIKPDAINGMASWKRKVCEQILSQPLKDGSYVDHC